MTIRYPTTIVSVSTLQAGDRVRYTQADGVTEVWAVVVAMNGPVPTLRVFLNTLTATTAEKAQASADGTLTIVSPTLGAHGVPSTIKPWDRTNTVG